MPFQRLRSELPKHERFGNDALLELIQALGWIRTNDSGIAVIAPFGDRLLGLPDGAPKLRRALLDYVEVVRPPWTMFALDGRKKTLGFAPIEFGQSMTEAYLAEGYDDEVIEFWDRLAAIARGQQDIRLSAIGRDGERLSLAYEKHRTGRDPIWRSIESNADGYDVMSVVSREDFAQLPDRGQVIHTGARRVNPPDKKRVGRHRDHGQSRVPPMGFEEYERPQARRHRASCDGPAMSPKTAVVECGRKLKFRFVNSQSILHLFSKLVDSFRGSHGLSAFFRFILVK